MFCAFCKFLPTNCCLCPQDAQDAFLEQRRDQVLTKKLVLMQKAIRGWHYRRKFQKMQSSCVVLQTYMRGYLSQLKYQQVSFDQSVKFI